MIMYNDTEDAPALQDTAPLKNKLPNHSIPKHDGEASV